MVTPLWPWLLNEPTITGNLDRRAETTPDAVAFMDEHDRSLTWAQFDTSVDRVVAGLLRKVSVGEQVWPGNYPLG